MSFRLVNVAGRAALLRHDAVFDLEATSAGRFSSSPMEAIARYRELGDVDLGSSTPTGRLPGTRLGPPVPTPSKVFAIGLNYRAHAVESKMDLPEVPLVFGRFPNCISGPNDDVVLRSDRCDYEAEIVVVIGENCKDVAEDEAWSRVAGLTCGQDVSDRRLQFAAQPPQFGLAKSYDTFGPIGPAVVSVDALDDPDAVPIRCEINGEERQSSSTDDLIFSVPQLIAYLSRVTRLLPGDLIFTGTPSGVGAARKTYLQESDLIVTEARGIGTMRNRCVRDRDATP